MSMTTIRTLVVLRHAKAEQPTGVADVDRPLSERGHADAGAAGAWLITRGYIPDLVICSPARRTRQTWHGVAVALAGEGSPEVRYETAVYGAGPTELFDLLRAVPAETGMVLLIGHNPTVSLLSGALDPAGLSDSEGLRTSGLAIHAPEVSWDALGPGRARLVAGHTPRA
jgi:phosphohistidine phosphatase